VFDFTKELLLKEVYHRTKNNMQIISSLLRLQSKHILDQKYADIFLDSFNRINAMSLIHEKVYKTESLSHIDAGEYIDSLTEAILKAYGNGLDKIAIKTNIERVFINLDVGIPMGLILNELISNAMKHAFPDDRAGTVEISLRYTAPKSLELIVRDDGVGFPDGVEFRRSKSLGLKLVALQAEGQLDGKITFDGTRGTCYKIEFKEK
jgi:two-component sensor histidine kinase